MGCFLTMTARDYDQLSATQNRAISLVGVPLGNDVTIRVHPSQGKSARQMAAMIRRTATSAEVTTPNARQQQQLHPTAERMIDEMAMLAAVAPYLVVTYANKAAASASGTWSYAEGKIAEHIVAEVLHNDPDFGLTIHHITNSTGVDITASQGAQAVLVEVKKAGAIKSFGNLLGTGYNVRQCSNAWLSEVNVPDPQHARVLGVHVNPDAGMITVYERRDSEATIWEPIKNIPLSQSEIARDLYDI